MEKSNPQNDEIDLLDYLHVLVKRRRMILRNSLIAAVLMAVLSFIMPEIYTASTTLLPPDENDRSGLAGLLANSPISFLNLPGLSSSTSEIFVEILNSRTVAERVLGRQYDFEGKQQSLYDILRETSKEKAVKRLQGGSRISVNEQGIIRISVDMPDRDLAAMVANTYVEELDQVNQEKSFSKAKNSRIYIEEQLNLTEDNLEKAARSLAEFQLKYKAVNLEEQTKVAIEKAGELKGAIMAKEVQMQVLLQTMKKNNPYVLKLQTELDEMGKQYEHLQFGNSVPFEEQKDYFIPFSDVPEVGLKYAEHIRDLKVQETVWQLLNQQYYSTKIQEARDTPTVQVLDPAVPPELRTSPKRKFLVIMAFLVTFGFSAFAAFVMEYNEKIKLEENKYQKLNGIKDALAGDFRKFKDGMSALMARIKGKKGLDD